MLDKLGSENEMYVLSQANISLNSTTVCWLSQANIKRVSKSAVIAIKILQIFCGEYYRDFK